MATSLVIVESPAKIKTLSKILGKGYRFQASLGHIRDLPRSRLGVEINGHVTPKYVVPREKAKVVKELKEAAGKVGTVYLATDPDREGEAIAWHIAEVTRLDHKPSYKRVVFHELTPEAIEEAFKHPRGIDMSLVNAQQARRVLDRLVGYELSPILWRKVKRGLSAGRVQSVTLRIVVDREREIEKFVPQEYWVIKAELAKQTKAPAFLATLISLAKGAKLEIHTQEKAGEVKADLEPARYRVAKVATKKVSRAPAPPFITSTLQQEAWRQLRFSASQTMAVAQKLYEGLPVGDEGSVGLITYMRTDSVRVAQSAIAETREFIQGKYGEDYLPPRARIFTRTVKGAQEAHEAIRPTRVGREPAAVKPYLNRQQFLLYDLIWKRMVASQMANALYDNTTVDIEAKNQRAYLLRTSASVNRFPGFIVLYTEGKDEAEKEEGELASLPPMEKGELLKLLKLLSEQRFTQPPPRFTEATLVKMLEQLGIGRPSTYAPTLETIREREYVTKERGVFQPTPLGMLVTDLLVQHFPDIVDVEFTAHMEQDLDAVASEQKSWEEVVRSFYTPFKARLEEASQKIEKVKVAPEVTSEVCPKCSKPLVIKEGRFGKFLACSGFPECKFTKSFQIKTGAKCPECGQGEMVMRISKKKRRFYGCNRYPECKFATNLRPLPQPCPSCKGLLVEYRKGLSKCTRCDYKGKIEEAVPVANK